ncbi:MAG: M56 family metallopeptidase [Butyricicoccus sp.]|nr:M56 family metallopeptidase [Butyricicoccus sp.]MCM1232981.1 M56 family metallopeptidase [Ruminococcus flavefaciens]
MGVEISSYSLVTTIILYNLALVLIFFLRGKNSFMARCGTEVLLFITLLAVVRLLSPVDLSRAYIVRSEKFAPAVIDVIQFSPSKSFPAFNLGWLVVCIWLTGTFWFVEKYASELYAALRSRKAYVSVSNEEAERTMEKLGVKYPVVISRQVLLPHTAGFFRPAIYLPDIKLSQREWEYVLRHEVQHIKAHDVWIKLFYAILETVMWWNPVSHLFMRELDSLLELRCDAAILSRISEYEGWEYFTTICKVLAIQQKKLAGSTEMASAYLATSENHVQERFHLAMDLEKRPHPRIKHAAYAVALALFCLSYFVVIQLDYHPPLDEAAGMITDYEDNTGDLFILFADGKYTLYVNNIFSKNLSATDLAQEPYNALPIYFVEENN